MFNLAVGSRACVAFLFSCCAILRGISGPVKYGWQLSDEFFTAKELKNL